MATYSNTAKYLLRKITGTSDRDEIDDGIGALADDIDENMAGYAQGTLAAIPGAGKAGRFYRTTDTGQVFMDTGSSWIEIGVAPWQPGDLKLTALTSAPAGWLMCDGSAVSRTTYAALYAALGGASSPFGQGNGSTTFNVPDWRGRVFVMPDGGAGRMASNDARGQAGGAETYTLSTSELPSHVHAGASGAFVVTGPGDSFAQILEGQPGGVNGHSANTAAAGGGGAFNKMDPYLVGGAVLIKT